jgi:hypothetical protein
MLYHSELTSAIRQNMHEVCFRVVVDGVALRFCDVRLDFGQYRNNPALEEVQRWWYRAAVMISMFLSKFLDETGDYKTQLHVDKRLSEHCVELLMAQSHEQEV